MQAKGAVTHLGGIFTGQNHALDANKQPAQSWECLHEGGSWRCAVVTEGGPMDVSGWHGGKEEEDNDHNRNNGEQRIERPKGPAANALDHGGREEEQNPPDRLEGSGGAEGGRQEDTQLHHRSRYVEDVLYQFSNAHQKAQERMDDAACVSEESASEGEEGAHLSHTEGQT